MWAFVGVLRLHVTAGHVGSMEPLRAHRWPCRQVEPLRAHGWPCGQHGAIKGARLAMWANLGPLGNPAPLDRL